MLKKINTFLREVRFEMSKVSWSDKDEIIGSTSIVIISTFILAVFIGFADFLMSLFVKFLIR